MSDTAFIMQSCTKSIAGAEDAIHLLEQKSRLEQAVSSNDPALTLDTSKSLLESIFKTILTDREPDPKLNKDFSPLYADVRRVITLNSDSVANEILKRLTNAIVHNVGELRNKYGAASHGDDAYYENPIEMPEAEMIAHIVDGMGGFLFRKHKSLNDPEAAQRIFYSDYAVFNDWLDSQNDSIIIPVEGAKQIPFSVFLFTYDVDTYRAMLLQYIQTELEDSDSTTESTLVDETVVVHEEASDQEEKVAKEEKLDTTADIAAALYLNDEVKNVMADDELIKIAGFVRDYATNKAGVDWQSREPLLAKFRIQLKRLLNRYKYPEALVDEGIEVLIAKAVEYFPSEGAQ